MHAFAANLHPVLAGLLAHHHHGKKFHIGSMQLAHMTGSQGALVIFIAICLVVAAAVWKFLLKSSK